MEDEEVVQDELATIQKEAMIAQLKLDINEALEAMDLSVLWINESVKGVRR